MLRFYLRQTLELSLVCLVVAGLCLRSVQKAYEADPGFETRRLALLPANPGEAGYSDARAAQYYREARARVARLPGVEAVSWASNYPLFGGPSRGIVVPGEEQRATVATPTSVVNTVGLDYFRTIGLPVRRGREFQFADRAGAAPVAMVNEAFAAAYWPGREVVGQHFRFSGETIDREIVGLVKTAKLTFLGEPPQPCVYLPLAQTTQAALVLYVRTTGEPAPVLGAARRELRAMDPQVVAADATTIGELMDNNLWAARLVASLLAAFGLLGLGLACVGLYGVMAYAVGSRRREIGLRLALGARRGRVLRLVMGQGLGLVMVGLAGGLALALLVGQAVSAVLFGISPADPLSLGGAALTLLLVAAVACYLPARRASRVDPVVALREG